MTQHFYAAVDLGASSGRVNLGRLDHGRIDLVEAHRFPTHSFTRDGHLHWNMEELFSDIVTGLQAAARSAAAPMEGIAVDTWGVDYGRLDASGTLLDAPFHYRDARTNAVPERFFHSLSAKDLYRQCGLQVMDFNTVFQLVADCDQGSWDTVAHCLFLPDLLTYWLSGTMSTELTIASTSGLLDIAQRNWSHPTLDHLLETYGIPTVFPDIVEPGTIVGSAIADPAFHGVPVIAVGSHDTASAIASIPTKDRNFAYISSGTWSLVGLELDHPILTEESRAANFTNELGADGTVCYLQNIMGLWVLSESQHWWQAHKEEHNLHTLLQQAEHLPALRTVVNMEDPRLVSPGDMPVRLAAMARETGQPVPSTPAEFTRCILDSLALSYRKAIRAACDLAGASVHVVHVVGGGCLNRLLNQLTAEATGLPVIAGPAEGTSLGNLMLQARAAGALSGDLMDLRRVSLASSDLTTYMPGVLDLPQAAWDNALRRAFG